MTTKVLNVWWDSRVVGQFTQDRHGDIAFQYADAWLGDQNTPPLSASLPKRPEQFYVLAWLASKISTTKSAMSGSISLACLAWNDGGAFIISVRLPISADIIQKTAPNVRVAAINNAILAIIAT